MLFLSAVCCGGAFVSAQEPTTIADQEAVQKPTSPSVGLPLSSKDPTDLREKDIAEFIGPTVKGRITQRFEMYCPRSDEDLRRLKEMGFTQVILDRVKLHSAATEIGLKVVLGNWWSEDTDPEEIDRGLRWARAVEPVSLIGFSIQDEPERNAPTTHFQFYIDMYERLLPLFRHEHPHTRIEISHWGPMASLTDEQLRYYSLLYRAADVMRIMPYPDIHEAPLDDVYFIMQRSRKVMRIAGRELPLVVILQTWVHPPKNKLPEIGELRVMAYQAMLSGAETLSFYNYDTDVWDRSAGFHEQFGELMKELTGLSERYREHEIATSINAQGILTSTLRSPDGEISKIEINARRQSVKGFSPLEVRHEELRSHARLHSTPSR
ncbi:hypothetical protein [Rhodopirellula sallentina]|uniref:hypothetical protein n=1 Tax=Rhodopirellula sallentina TaxID=1263869 RepID=UPI001181BD1C|nr:hypothetical protein [Rhodopirellula sallentina]